MTVKLIDMNNQANESVEILNQMKKSVGMIPNIYSIMGHSPTVLKAYLNYAGALSGLTLSKAVQEKIALAVSGVNDCGYCMRAHFAVGKMLKETESELKLNITGTSSNADQKEIVELAAEIARVKGKLSSESLSKAISKFGEKGLVEIYGCVMATIFTNFFNEMTATKIDFPEIT